MAWLEMFSCNQKYFVVWLAYRCLKCVRSIDCCFTWRSLVIKVENITFPSLLMSHCLMKRKPQKIVPSRNISHFEPLKFVFANLKISPICKIKARRNYGFCNQRVWEINNCEVMGQITNSLKMTRCIFNTVRFQWSVSFATKRVN